MKSAFRTELGILIALIFVGCGGGCLGIPPSPARALPSSALAVRAEPGEDRPRPAPGRPVVSIADLRSVQGGCYLDLLTESTPGETGLTTPNGAGSDIGLWLESLEAPSALFEILGEHDAPVKLRQPTSGTVFTPFPPYIAPPPAQRIADDGPNVRIIHTVRFRTGRGLVPGLYRVRLRDPEAWAAQGLVIDPGWNTIDVLR